VEGSSTVEISEPPRKRTRRVIQKSVESDPPEPRVQRPRRAAAKKNTGEATTPPDEPPTKKTRVRRSKALQPQPDAEAGPSSAAGPSSSQAPRSKKKKAPASPAPESRGAPFFTSCPQNIQDRVGRVMTQRYEISTSCSCFRSRILSDRFFMIERRRNGGELQEEFSVLGSTGNVSSSSAVLLPSIVHNLPGLYGHNWAKTQMQLPGYHQGKSLQTYHVRFPER